MRCPWCSFDDHPRALHAHLAETHGEQIRTYPMGDRQFYEVVCPHCGESYDQRIKKAGADDAFVAEFEQQIRMVAFDMLINHLLVEHEHQPAGE
jgi:phage terminase large subunit GpA-like protein